MPVDRRTGDAELGGDLRDGVAAFAGLVELVVHLPRQLGKGVRVEFVKENLTFTGRTRQWRRCCCR
jgi:hypothetical protein